MKTETDTRPQFRSTLTRVDYDMALADLEVAASHLKSGRYALAWSTARCAAGLCRIIQQAEDAVEIIGSPSDVK